MKINKHSLLALSICLLVACTHQQLEYEPEADAGLELNAEPKAELEKWREESPDTESEPTQAEKPPMDKSQTFPSAEASSIESADLSINEATENAEQELSALSEKVLTKAQKEKSQQEKALVNKAQQEKVQQQKAQQDQDQAQAESAQQDESREKSAVQAKAQEKADEASGADNQDFESLAESSLSMSAKELEKISIENNLEAKTSASISSSENLTEDLKGGGQAQALNENDAKETMEEKYLRTTEKSTHEDDHLLVREGEDYEGGEHAHYSSGILIPHANEEPEEKWILEGHEGSVGSKVNKRSWNMQRQF